MSILTRFIIQKGDMTLSVTLLLHWLNLRSWYRFRSLFSMIIHKREILVVKIFMKFVLLLLFICFLRFHSLDFNNFIADIYFLMRTNRQPFLHWKICLFRWSKTKLFSWRVRFIFYFLLSWTSSWIRICIHILRMLFLVLCQPLFFCCKIR